MRPEPTRPVTVGEDDDIAQRGKVDRDMLSFTVPWSLFLEMEASVPGSFLEMEDWRELRKRQ